MNMMKIDSYLKIMDSPKQLSTTERSLSDESPRLSLRYKGTVEKIAEALIKLGTD